MIPKKNLPIPLQELLKNNEHAISLYQTPVGYIKYMVTNLRVVNCINKNNIRSCYYSQVFKIAMGSGKYINKILFFTQPKMKGITPQNKHDIFFMENISNAREAFKVIGEIWSKESPYMQRIKAFGKLANDYGLSLTTKTNPRGQSIIHIKG